MNQFQKYTTMISFFLLLLFTNVYTQNKISIAVMDLDAENISNSDARIISARLRTDLFNTEKFIVLERDKMDDILQEQGFQLSGCTKNECVVEVGKLTGVEQMVAGNIGKIGKIITITIRLIDVETGHVLKTATEDCECSIETVVTQSVRNVAQILAGEKVQTSTYKETKEVTQFGTINNLNRNGFTEKSISKATLLGLLPGMGLYYTDNYLLGTIFLFWDLALIIGNIYDANGGYEDSLQIGLIIHLITKAIEMPLSGYMAVRSNKKISRTNLMLIPRVTPQYYSLTLSYNF